MKNRPSLVIVYLIVITIILLFIVVSLALENPTFHPFWDKVIYLVLTISTGFNFFAVAGAWKGHRWVMWWLGLIAALAIYDFFYQLVRQDWTLVFLSIVLVGISGFATWSYRRYLHLPGVKTELEEKRIVDSRSKT